MVRRFLSDSEIDAQIPAARRRAELLLRTRPHAKSVRYVKAQRMLHVALTNGASFALPVAFIPGLDAATDAELADVVASPFGVGLRWERLDTDISVAALARLALGPWVLLRAAGAAGGSVRTRAKARAARLNGRKGGRPRKSRRKTAV